MLSVPNALERTKRSFGCVIFYPIFLFSATRNFHIFPAFALTVRYRVSMGSIAQHLRYMCFPDVIVLCSRLRSIVTAIEQLNGK